MKKPVSSIHRLCIRHILRGAAALCAAPMLLSFAQPVSAQTRPRQVQTIDHVPGADVYLGKSIAVNPNTHQLYVTGALSGSGDGVLKLVDTTTNLALADTAASRFSTYTLAGVAVDAAGGRYYQLDGYSKSIGVCDAATHAVLKTVSLPSASFGDGQSVRGIAVNPTTHLLYVTIGGRYDQDSGIPGRVLVVDPEAGNVTATVPVGPSPFGVAVDETLNRIYIQTLSVDAASANNVLDAIDGATLAVTPIPIPLPAGTMLRDDLNPTMAVNPATHRVYATLQSTNSQTPVSRIAVIDSATNTLVTQIELGPGGNNYVESLAVETSTNRIFAGGAFDVNGKVGIQVFDGGSNLSLGSIKVSLDPDRADSSIEALAADSSTGKVYALFYGTRLEVIDAQSLIRLPNVVIPLGDTLNDSISQQKSALDPALGRLFVANDATSSITVIDTGTGRTITNIPIKTAGGTGAVNCLAINPTTHTLYATVSPLNQIVAIDAVTATITSTRPVPDSPRELAIDATRNRIYISTAVGVSVLDGGSSAAPIVIAGVAPRTASRNYGEHAAIAVNPVTNRIYVTGFVISNNYQPMELDVIDGDSLTVINRLYPGQQNVSINTGTIAVNTVTNKVYLVNRLPGNNVGSNPPTGLYEIDGVTGAATSFAPPNGRELAKGSVAVDPVLNRVYIAAYQQSGFSVLASFDVGTSTMVALDTAPLVPALAVDASSGRFYLSGNFGSGDVTKVYVSDPPFFTGQAALGNGVFYLQFLSGNPFGYYSYLPDSHYIYHFDLGYEYVFDAADGNAGVYLYDFTSGSFFYTSPGFPFPYLYDFSLNTVLYYFPDPNNAGHYNTDGVRYFVRLDNGQIITK